MDNKLQEIRKAVADYMAAQNVYHFFGRSDLKRELEHAEERLALLLNVPRHDDGSGYDFGQFASK